MLRQRKPAAAASPDPAAQPAADNSAAQQPAQPPAAAAAAAPPTSSPHDPVSAPPKSPLALVTSLLAAWLLLLVCQGAYHLLAPQLGGWLAGLCTSVLLPVGVAGAAVGTTAVAAWQLHGLAAGGGSGPSAAARRALWVAAGSVLVSKQLARLLGALLLSPGLTLDDSIRLTDTWLVGRSLALALLAFGPAVGSLGFVAGEAGSRALLPLHPSGHWLLLGSLGMLAARAAVYGAPGTPPKPAATIPAIVAVAAAVLAAALSQAASMEQQQQQPEASAPAAQGAAASGSRAPAARQRAPRPRRQRLGGLPRAWLAAAAVAVIAAAQVARGYPCRHYDPAVPLAGGQYGLLYSCEAHLGGYVSVVEGELAGQYRYRLLRLDHSIMGGEYMAPPEVAGQSVYTAFYLQQAILAARPINATTGRRPRSLHIGLGIGTAVKGLQRAGTVADVLELHEEVAEAAAAYFGSRPLGRTLPGDALRTLGTLPDGSYDYVIHDVFSGAGAPGQPLMREGFFRRLRAKLAPGGVVAVNYVGSKGQPLKQLWCRLRVAFDNVRAFGDQEKAAVKNYVVFASDSSLEGMEEQAAALLAAEGAEQLWDPPAREVLRTLGRSEVKFTFDRQRCVALLELEEEERKRAAGTAGAAGPFSGQRPPAGGGGGPLRGLGTNLPPGLLREAGAAAQQQGQQQAQQPASMEELMAAAAAAAASGAGGPGADPAAERRRYDFSQHPKEIPRDLLEAHRRSSAERGGKREPPPRRRWAVERWKEETARGHAAAAYHWVVMRQQLEDELWQSY